MSESYDKQYIHDYNWNVPQANPKPINCNHKFIDSVICVKCGISHKDIKWTTANEQQAESRFKREK